MRGCLSLCFVICAALGCAGGGPLPSEGGLAMPSLSSIEAPIPILPGSLVRAHGTLVGISDDVRLVMRDESEGSEVTLWRNGGAIDEELLFSLDSSGVAAFGVGVRNVEATLFEGDRHSESISLTIEIETSLAISLLPLGDSTVHRNDAFLLRGNGFLGAGEGSVTIGFSGTYTRARDAAVSSVNTRLPVAIADLVSRDRGFVVLSTALGGIEAGVFDGTVSLQSRLLEGQITSSDPRHVTLTFVDPEVFSFGSPTTSLGAYVRVLGAGFVGGAESSDEVTTLRLSGTFTDERGTERTLSSTELVPEFVSGSEVRFPLDAVPEETTLISSLFGAARGTFEGTIVPVTVKGTVEVEGYAAPLSLTLGPVTQVVLLQFLPGYFDSLLRFGLAQASSQIASGLVERVSAIFADYAVDVRLEAPEDFPRTGYSIVDIGGPDPSGRGLFGYDNSPGKDVGNLRLYDALGGVNAEQQMDGSPGYGGVFVESVLFYSAHPNLPPIMVGAAPDSDPLFDSVFDPVRERAATVEELRGIGNAARVEQVRAAVHAFSALIGETIAHELGHSFGLAQPYGSTTTYHDPNDEPGCLMEFGTNRPFGERAELDGFETTHLCADAPDYLESILGR
ncbi:MAG: hypothetical protein IPK60_20175 [Sandaracinaceae bacterium]|jgi:hypothetical protein|nr:hypothetical protein [Sandaracinaceae bacterium]